MSEPRTKFQPRTALWAAVKLSTGISLTEEQLDRVLDSFAANRWSLHFGEACPDCGASDRHWVEGVEGITDHRWLHP